jgi:hypothetical protein
VFGQLLGVQEPGKSVAVDVVIALGKKAPEDLGLERLERGFSLGDLFEGIAHLLVCESVGAAWMRNQVIDGDFWRCGHWLLALSVDVRKSFPILFMLRAEGNQFASFSAHRAR